MLGEKPQLLTSYGPISKALLLDCKLGNSVHIFRKPCLLCSLPSYTLQLTGLYKLVSTNVNLKETVLYGRSSVELSGNPNECGMDTTAKKG